MNEKLQHELALRIASVIIANFESPEAWDFLRDEQREGYAKIVLPFLREYEHRRVEQD